MKENFPDLKLAPTVSACCNTCLKMDASITTISDEIKVLEMICETDENIKPTIVQLRNNLKQRKKQKQQHEERQQKEKDFYSDRKTWLRQEDQRNIVDKKYGTFPDNVLHLSIDAMQNKSYPTFTGYKEPALYYFTKKITFHLLGVVNEGMNTGEVYLYDQRIGPTNSNHTISALQQAMKTQIGNRKVLWINMDNCAVNKNRYVS